MFEIISVDSFESMKKPLSIYVLMEVFVLLKKQFMTEKGE
jgi:hypothetical protein